MKKRVLMIDSRGFGAVLPVIRDCRARLDFTLLDKKDIRRVPRDYDTYILHLSDIDMKDLEDLRREQPWSRIYGLSGRGGAEILPELRKNMDELYGRIWPNEYA